MLSTQKQHATPSLALYPSDAALITQSIVGDQLAFAVLMERYGAPLRMFTYRYLQNNDMVEDIVQQVFLQLYICLPTLVASNTIRPWLFRVARNRCVDEIRKRRRRPISSLSDLEGHDDEDNMSPLTNDAHFYASPEEIAEIHEALHTVFVALRTLPPATRTIILWRCRDQMSFDEIAVKLHLTESSVKTRYYRALSKLRLILASDTGRKEQ